MQVNSINNTPSFSGLKIRKDIPQRLAKIIEDNPAIQKEAQHLNLTFIKETQNPTNPFVGALVCTIAPIKKFFPAIAKKAQKTTIVFGDKKHLLTQAITDMENRTGGDKSFFTVTLLEKNNLTRQFKAHSKSLNEALSNFYARIAREQS